MKRTLYIIVIVIALGGAAVMGYMALTSGPTITSTDETSTSDQAVYNILPQGKTLDFDTIKNFNKDERLFPYPQVNSAEIGTTLGNLIE